MTLLFVHQVINQRDLLTEIYEYLTDLGTLKLPDFSFFVVDPDVHILNSDKKSVGIAQIKEFVTRLHLKPFKHPWQIAIIYNFDNLTIEAQNSLLKELEDHSDSTYYILTTANLNKILPTIKSRSNIVYIKSQTADRPSTDINVTQEFWQVYTKITNQNITKEQVIDILRTFKQNIQKYEDVAATGMWLDEIDLLYKMIYNNVSPKNVLLYFYLILSENKNKYVKDNF